jgi:hypothetical protein
MTIVMLGLSWVHDVEPGHLSARLSNVVVNKHCGVEYLVITHLKPGYI